MDAPTIAVLIAFLLLIGITAILKLSDISLRAKTTWLCFSVMAIWAVMTFLGEFSSLAWASNTACSKFLGCITGFAGYDGFEHLFFGMVLVYVFLWVGDRFPKLSFANKERWKTVITIIAFVMFAGVLWEFGECAHDAFRLSVLKEPLINVKLHIDYLDQPTNIDTMGDLFFALIGACIALPITSLLSLLP